MTQLFSIVAMFIMFRETLEACIVVAVMLNLCTKLNLPRMKRQVWFGVASGVTLSILLGVAFIIAFYVTQSRVFNGAGKSIFKGYINMLASFLIALLGFAMLRFVNYEAKWRKKLLRMQKESEAKRKESGKAANWAIFLLCFSAVFREGIEAVVFLAGVSQSVKATEIPLAAVVGIICGLAVGFLLFYTGREIKDMWWFFILSFIVLFMIGAGLVSTGISSWQFIGWFGYYWPAYYRPWWNQALWDTCGCCSDNIQFNKFFGLINAIFGYQCQPTFISVFSYVMFWVIVLTIVFVKWRRGSLTDAFYKLKKQENKRRAKEGLPPMTKAEEEALVNGDLEEEFGAKLPEDEKDSPRHSTTSSSDIDPKFKSESSDELKSAKDLKVIEPEEENIFNVKPKETEMVSKV